MGWSVLADLVLLFHAAYVGYVVFGLVAIVLGIALGWSWVRNFWFRLTHLGAIGLVVAESIVGVACPLTTLENRRCVERILIVSAGVGMCPCRDDMMQSFAIARHYARPSI